MDEMKLKPCHHCDLVHCCSDKCLQEQDHRELHQEECKRRAATMADEILFKQPESTNMDDCPICFLPMPLYRNERVFQDCCSTIICHGCSYADNLSSWKQGHEIKCPFCRKIVDATDEESAKRMMRRVEANDPIALETTGDKYYEEEDYENAFRYYTKAVEAGNMNASFQLGLMYLAGQFVHQDSCKCIFLWETAAVGGHIGARMSLGHFEFKNRRYDRAVKHWIIAANLGDVISIQWLKKCYKDGHVSKDDFAIALRAHQAACDAMKSPQREESRRSEIQR